MPSGKELKSWYDQLKNARRNFDPQYEDVARYIVPNRQGFITKLTPGTRLTNYLYDSTAVMSAPMLAASTHGALTSSAIQWFKLEFRNPELRKIANARKWLEDAGHRMYRAINDSNFASQVAESYLDLGSFGTMSTLIEEQQTRHGQPTTQDRFQGLRFTSLNLAHYWISEDGEGMVDTIAREIEMRASAALKRWPETLPEKIRKAAEKSPFQRFTFLHIITPRENHAPVQAGVMLTGPQRPWASYYIEPDSGQLLEEEGYYEWPAPTARWSQASGEIYGRGPGFIALPDVKTINKAKELGLKAWAKLIDPPLKRRHNGIIGRVSLQPGKTTTVREMDDLQPIIDPSNYRFDLTQFREEELKLSIRQAFYVDQLVLPPPMPGSQMTATEASIRYEIMQRLLGPTLGRLESEYLNPTVERVFALMMRNNAFAQMPPELTEAQGDGKIDVQYVGPLARSQHMEEVANTQRWIGDLGGMAEMLPEVLDNIEPDGTAELLADRYGVPERARRTEKSRDEIRTERTENAKTENALALRGAQAEIGKQDAQASAQRAKGQGQ